MLATCLIGLAVGFFLLFVAPASVVAPAGLLLIPAFFIWGAVRIGRAYRHR